MNNVRSLPSYRSRRILAEQKTQDDLEPCFRSQEGQFAFFAPLESSANSNSFKETGMPVWITASLVVVVMVFLSVSLAKLVEALWAPTIAFMQANPAFVGIGLSVVLCVILAIGSAIRYRHYGEFA